MCVFIPIHPQLKDTLLDAAGQDDPEAPILPTLLQSETNSEVGYFPSAFNSSLVLQPCNAEKVGGIDPQPYRKGEGKVLNHEPAFAFTSTPFAVQQFDDFHAGEQSRSMQSEVQATTEQSHSVSAPLAMNQKSTTHLVAMERLRECGK